MVFMSKRMIACARAKAAALGAKASWVCCDVLGAPHSLDATADLVYTGRGAIPWMMDLRAWAHVVFRLLKPGGRLFVLEGHPLDWVWDAQASEFRFHPERNSYFSDGIEGGERWPAPFLARQEGASIDEAPFHERQWTLGQVVSAVLDSGLALRHFDEYPDPYWGQFPNIPPEVLSRLPHTFSMMAEKGE